MVVRPNKRNGTKRQAKLNHPGELVENKLPAKPSGGAKSSQPAEVPAEPEMDEPTNGKEEEAEGEDRSGFALRPESEKVIRELGHVFRLLSDESRLRILAYLMQEGELHVTDLCARLGQTQPAVSHHLALLRVAGVIEPRREGKHNYYRICIDRLGEMLIKLLSTSGSMPKKLRFHDFTLTHMGR